MSSENDSSQAHELSTRILHPEFAAPDGFVSLTTAIHHASTIVFPTVAEMRARTWDRDDTYSYGLRGTPTTAMLERQLASIEGGQHCVLAPSGLAAITMIDMAFLNAGDEVLLPANAYQPGRDFAQVVLCDYGVRTVTYDPMNAGAVAALMSPHTKLMWIEAPGSVTLEMPDIRALVAAATARGVTTAIDATWAAGIALKPFELGIDISMQALTKYQSGGSDVLMGAAITRDRELHLKIKYSHMRLGLGVGQDDAYLILRGLKSMPLRFAQHDASARTIAAWCTDQPHIARVLHPALPSSPGHVYWQRDFNGAGGLVSIVFDESIALDRVDAFVDALRIFKIGYSWGGAISLAVPYRLDAARTKHVGRGGIVRLAIGLESPDDLIADLAQAMRVIA